MKKSYLAVMGLTLVMGLATSAFAADACNDNMGHSGNGTQVSGNRVGSISGTPWGFEQWYQGGNASMTYYSNGTFKANWSGSSDYLTRVGYQYNGNGIDHKTKSFAVDYKYTKTGNASYGYIGVYGWTKNPETEYYIVDDWYSKPSEQYVGEKFGEITVDGAKYSIHAFLRQQEPSKSGTSTFVQFFSIRETPRQCGHIDISAHFKKWDELFTGQTKQLRGSKGGASASLKFGNVTEVMLMTEAGGNATGSVDYSYFNMTDNAQSTPTSSSSVKSSSSSAKSSSSQGGGSTGGAVDACKADMGHSGNGSQVSGNKVGSISGTPWGYEQWYQGGNASMTYYNNGTFKANWSGSSDYLTRVGYQYNGNGIDHKTKNFAVDYKYTKTGNASYGYIGVYGWTKNPETEYYIVDDWYSKPSEQYVGEKFGEITVDGAKYTIHAFLRQQEPSKSGTSTFVQFFSIRETPRQCGHIDISAHFKKWDELFTGQNKQLRGSKGGASASLKFGNVTEVMLMTEAGGNATGSVDYTYFNMTDKYEAPKSSSSEAKSSSSTVGPKSSSTIGPVSSSSTIAIPVEMQLQTAAGTFQVFDMQGRFLGKLEVTPCESVTSLLKARFQNSGIYLLKQGRTMHRVAVR